MGALKAKLYIQIVLRTFDHPIFCPHILSSCAYITSSTVEPPLSILFRRHTISSDNQGVRIDDGCLLLPYIVSPKRYMTQVWIL